MNTVWKQDVSEPVNEPARDVNQFRKKSIWFEDCRPILKMSEVRI